MRQVRYHRVHGMCRRSSTSSSLGGAAMECTTCVQPSGRRDKPHTFFAHEFTTCGACGGGARGARRAARRRGRHAQALHGLRPAGALVADRRPRPGWPAFLARGEVPDGLAGDHLFKHTTSTCPTCLALLAGRRRDPRRAASTSRRTARRCGPSEALVSEDASYYVRAYALRARRHRAAQVRAARSSTAARPTAAPATTTSSTPACPSSRSPTTATSSARSASSTTSTRTTWSPRRSRSIVDGLVDARGAAASRSRCRAASRPATRSSST